MKKSKINLFITFLLVLSLLLAGCAPKQVEEGNTNNDNSSKSLAGDYTGEFKGFTSDVLVTITLDETGKIAKGSVDANGETPDIGGKAAPLVFEEIIANQSLEVDSISGATLTSTAVLKATEIALTSAGVDLSNYKTIKEASGHDEEVTVDVVVVGAGASGTTAALAALEKGASVLMVEKTNGIGGISKHWAGGPFAIETDIQKEAGYDLKKEDAFQTLIDYSHYISYAPLQKAILWKSSDTIDWLTSYGLSFYANPETPQISHQDDPMKWQNYHWYSTFGQEVAALDILHEKLDSMGLDLRLNTKAVSLIKDKEVVKGIVAEKEDGSKLIVNAKSVVLATGGFGGNADMMAEAFHTPYIGAWGPATGDGQIMAWDAGAAKWDVQSALLHGSGLVAGTNPGEIALGSSPFNQITRSPLLWIDQSGNRFCNEEAVYDTAYTSNVGYSVGGLYYIVLDKATLDAYTNGDHLVMDPAVGGPNMSPADFVELAEEGVAQGNIFKGQTLEELALNTGMDVDRFVANIQEYNKSVETKSDPYGKSDENLKFAVAEGPFYAAKMMISNLGTTGGIRVNEKLQATNIDLKPIPGLYAVGNDAGGYYGNVTAYPPYEGLATGFALNSGRIGGESAAEYAIGK